MPLIKQIQITDKFTPKFKPFFQTDEKNSPNDLQKFLKILLIRIQIQNRIDLIVLNTKNKLDEGHLEIRQFT